MAMDFAVQANKLFQKMATTSRRQCFDNKYGLNVAGAADWSKINFPIHHGEKSERGEISHDEWTIRFSIFTL